jgi:diadenosine tetraphosphate (Ap4A) HIT family hydrolase
MLGIVLQTDTFTASPCLDCDLPGYLVLVANEDQNAVSSLSPHAQAELGPTMGRLESAIKQVTRAEHIYVLRFSEGLSSVHFHFFPRTSQLAEQWLSSATPPERDLNGPHIFAWARIRYHVDAPEHLSANTLETAKSIREVLQLQRS